MLRVIQTKAINQIIPVSQLRYKKKQKHKKDQIVTTIMGNSMVKDIY